MALPRADASNLTALEGRRRPLALLGNASEGRDDYMSTPLIQPLADPHPTLGRGSISIRRTGVCEPWLRSASPSHSPPPQLDRPGVPPAHAPGRFVRTRDAAHPLRRPAARCRTGRGRRGALRLLQLTGVAGAP